MSRNEQRLLNAVLRNDLASFIHRAFQTLAPARNFMPNWHIAAIAWYLTQCYLGNIRRLIITLPPRGLKSICASVAFIAWILGRDPTRKIICVSYSEALAIKHSRDCRAVMQSPWYQRAFPRCRISPEKNSELEFATTAGGFRLAASVGGTLTGRGGNLIVIDDPLKPDDAFSKSQREAVTQWFDSTLYTRLDNKAEDAIVLVMQRLHEDDLVGHVLEREEWVHLSLPAIAEAPQRIRIGESEFHERAAGDLLHPEREPREALERIKENLGTFAFSAQYQQNPIPPEGTAIKWPWFRRYKTAPEKKWGDQVVQSWDTALKAGEANSFSVCTIWLVRGADFYLIDILREQLDYPSLKRRVVELAGRYQPDAVLIEDKGSGSPLIQDLRQEGSLRPIAITPEGDKETRMRAQSAKVEAGRVLLPEEAPWLPAFQAEVLQFPHGRHDDQIDSMSQFLAWVREQEQDGPSLESLEEMFWALNDNNYSGISYVKDGKKIPIPRKIGPYRILPW